MPVHWYHVAESILASFSITLNTVVLYSIYKRRLYIKTTDIFITHLAIADILVGLVYTTYVFQQIIAPHLDFWECLSMHTMMLMITNNAVFILLCVTMDRFFAVRFPLHYNRLIDTTTANRVLLVVWAVSILIGIVPWFWNKGSEHYSRCGFIEVVSRKYLIYFDFFFLNGIPVVAIVCIYIYINTVMRRLKRENTNTRISSGKYFGPILLISVVSVLLLPIHIINTLFYFEVINQSDEAIAATNAFVLLENCNHIVNPLIYASRYFTLSQNAFSLKIAKAPSNSSESPNQKFTSNLTAGSSNGCFPAPPLIHKSSSESSQTPSQTNSAKAPSVDGSILSDFKSKKSQTLTPNTSSDSGSSL